MKKTIYLLSLLTLLITACTNNKVQIEGTSNNTSNNGKQIYLSKIEKIGEVVVVDSTIIENGKFQFQLEATEKPVMAFLHIKNADLTSISTIPLVYENGTINITIDTIATASGTPLNDEQLNFSEKYTKLSEEYNTLINANAAESEIGKIKKKLDDEAFTFIKRNMKNPLGEFYFASFFHLFSESQKNELLAIANPEYKTFVEEAMKAEDTEGNLMGKEYIDIRGKNPEGQEIALSDYVGKKKVVLIDFWASWCGPCRQEMPHVVDAYKKYSDKGFEIVGISLDNDKEAWTKALSDMNMIWPQMSDLKGWESKLSQPYQINSIPYTLLVDENGKVIGENLRGDDLDKMLKNILN